MSLHVLMRGVPLPASCVVVQTETVYADGTRVFTYRNNTTRELSPEGHIIVRFHNGDIRKVRQAPSCARSPNERAADGARDTVRPRLRVWQTHTSTGVEVYYFAEAKTTHTSFPDGSQLYEFPNGQVERHFPDASKEIKYPDGTVKEVLPTGEMRSVFPDGTRLTELPDGRKVGGDLRSCVRERCGRTDWVAVAGGMRMRAVLTQPARHTAGWPPDGMCMHRSSTALTAKSKARSSHRRRWHERWWSHHSVDLAQHTSSRLTYCSD